MSVEQNKELVRCYLEQYVSKGNRATADDLVDEGVVFASPYSGHIAGSAREEVEDMSSVEERSAQILELDQRATEVGVFARHEDSEGGSVL